jgi:UMF1 family MFS transporter
MRRNFSLWILYDFANSLALINVAFYFSLWLVSDHGFSDFWVSIATALSTLVLLFFLPFLGHISDRLGKRKLFLNQFSLLAILSLGIMGWITMKVPFSTEVGFVVVLFYFLFQFFYQGSLTFYNAYIQDLRDQKTAHQISGTGMAFGQLGNIVGILLLLPIAEGTFEIFGETGRGATFFAAAVLFLIFALPTLLFLKEGKPTQSLEKNFTYKSSFKKVLKTPGVLCYLLSYYFFADAILTLQLFLGLYLEEVAGMDDKQKGMTLVLALLCGMLSAWFAPRLARWLKGVHRTIGLLILFWAILLALFAFAQTAWTFYLLLVLNGIAYGALFALSRSYYSEITPKDNQAEFFSIYVLFERAASILGPLIWSCTVLLFTDHGPNRYRYAMVSLALLVSISYLIYRKLPQFKTHESLR